MLAGRNKVRVRSVLKRGLWAGGTREAGVAPVHEGQLQPRPCRHGTAHRGTVRPMQCSNGLKLHLEVRSAYFSYR